MSGFIFIADASDKSAIDSIDRATREWTMKAARGECGWVCADCSGSFPHGMPDACAYGHQGCTDIIQRDKNDAMKAGKEPKDV